MDYKQEIIESRQKGFGSSDAKIIASIGRIGKLNSSGKRRVAQFLGLIERKQFSTSATDLGDNIEVLIYEILSETYPRLESNPFRKNEKLSKTFGFDVFNHIDYRNEDEQGNVFCFECKATIKNIEDTLNDYSYQFAWHKMIEPESKLFLVHYDTNDYNGVFQPEKISVIEVKNKFKVELSEIKNGLKIIKDSIPEFTFEENDELISTDLPEEVKKELSVIDEYLTKIERMQSEINEFKERMLHNMLKNSVKSIDNELFKITLVDETETSTFDSKKFKEEHPRLVKKYLKTNKKKAYIKISKH